MYRPHSLTFRQRCSATASTWWIVSLHRKQKTSTQCSSSAVRASHIRRECGPWNRNLLGDTTVLQVECRIGKHVAQVQERRASLLTQATSISRSLTNKQEGQVDSYGAKCLHLLLERVAEDSENGVFALQGVHDLIRVRREARVARRIYSRMHERIA